jgi:hypothetical protein
MTKADKRREVKHANKSNLILAAGGTRLPALNMSSN